MEITMQLYEEAEKISLFGIQVYRFGFFVALGLIAFAAVVSFLSWARRCKKGTAPLTIFTGILLGGVCSRLGFCLMDQELGSMLPLSSWIRITGGGWSMMTLVGGVLLAAWISAKILKEKTDTVLDIAACGLPAFMALERVGENCIPDFDYSRPLESTFLNNTFLAYEEFGSYYLATFRLAAIVMLVLFAVLMTDMIRSHRDGRTCQLFLVLFGGCSVILESLRYDSFLSLHFIGLEHVLAAVILAAGVIWIAATVKGQSRRTASAAVISVFAAAAVAVGIEFALDRTDINRVLLYVLYVLVMAVPVTLALIARREERN